MPGPRFPIRISVPAQECFDVPKKGPASKLRVALPIVEFAGLLALVVLADRFTAPGYGFLELLGLPYTVLPLVFGIFYGPVFAASAAGIVTVLLAAVFPFLHGGGYREGILEVYRSVRVSVPIVAVVTFAAVGRIRALQTRNAAYRSRIRRIGRETWTVQKKYHTMAAVQQELEARVSGQRDSIALLHEQLRRLERARIKQGPELLLETVALYSGCTRASVWRFDRPAHRLEAAGYIGYESDQKPFPYISLENTVQGWVVRHNQMYSVRMLAQVPGLSDYDDGATILAFPIRVRSHPWAVLSIESMPFERYNPYTETLLQLIIRLAEPVLERLEERDLAFAASEVDEKTGLPLYGMLVRAIEAEQRRVTRESSSLSLIIAEIRTPSRSSAEAAAAGKSAGTTEEHVRSFIPFFRSAVPDTAQLFHHKEPGQLACLVPNLDEGGTALLCLNIFSAAADRSLGMDFIIGYAAYTAEDSDDPVAFIARAENLLELQRI